MGKRTPARDPSCAYPDSYPDPAEAAHTTMVAAASQPVVISPPPAKSPTPGPFPRSPAPYSPPHACSLLPCSAVVERLLEV